jgi:hypothetical protein
MDGYYLFDTAKTSKKMRLSLKRNGIIDGMKYGKSAVPGGQTAQSIPKADVRSASFRSAIWRRG